VPVARRPGHRVRLPPHRRVVESEVHAARELGAGEDGDRLVVDLQLVAAGREAGDRERLLVERLEVGAGLLGELDRRVLEVEGQGQRLVELRPGQPAGGRGDVAHRRLLGRRDGGSGRVDRHARDDTRSVPGAEQRRAHEQVAGGSGVDAVGEDLPREVRVLLRHRGEAGVDALAEVGEAGLHRAGERDDVAAEAPQRVVVAGRELRRPGDVVERRRADEREPHARQLALEPFDDRAVASAKG
jgi:hypothetical protein